MHALKAIIDQFVKVDLQHIGIQNFNIGKLSESLREHGYEAGVKLKRDHLFCPFCKLRCENADSGSDFKHAGVAVRSARLSHSRTDGWIYQKVLSERL